MRFKVKHGFKANGREFEAGNTHDTSRVGVLEDDVMRWYRAGWVDIEGYPVGPALRPGHTEIAPNKLKINKVISSAQ